ncbi:MAG: YbbR-like domain-containing protein [Bacteroidota bacterium]
MENGFLQNWPRVSEGQKLQFRKKILLFSVFLLISVFIWLLNALSKNYTSVIEYPLVYTDFPEKRVLVGELPAHLDLSINADGYALLRYKTFRKPVPISFKVSAFTLNRPGQDSSRAYIQTRYLKDQVARQLPSELQLLEIKPDTLYFQFAKRVTRALPIKPEFVFEVDKQFTTIDGIRLEPDSVVVTGPDVIMDTLKYVSTVKTDLGLLTKNYSNKVKLDMPYDLEYGVSKVYCSIELERYTEVQLIVPIEVLNLPDSLSIQTFPDEIKLTCKVGLSKYDRMDKNLFRAVVDYSSVDDRTKELDVGLSNIPLYLLGFEYYPKSVEFLISRK